MCELKLLLNLLLIGFMELYCFIACLKHPLIKIPRGKELIFLVTVCEKYSCAAISRLPKVLFGVCFTLKMYYGDRS